MTVFHEDYFPTYKNCQKKRRALSRVESLYLRARYTTLLRYRYTTAIENITLSATWLVKWYRERTADP